MCQQRRLLCVSYVVKRCDRRQGEPSEQRLASDCAKLLYLCTNDRVLNNSEFANRSGTAVTTPGALLFSKVLDWFRMPVAILSFLKFH